MTKSKIFFYFCLSFIGGVSISSLISISQLTKLGFLILATILISVFWSRKNLVVIGLCLMFLTVGIWRYQTVELKLNTEKIDGQNISLVGIVSEDPILEKSKAKLKLSIQAKDFKGKVLIISSRYPEYTYGDKLRVGGFLETPPVFEEFDYKDYLKKEGICWVMYYPEIQFLGSDFGNPIKKASISLKHKLKNSLNKAMSMPQSGLMEALLFGEENNISKEWKEKLNLSGTRHIAAVSGMNITIIAALLLNLFLSVGFWRHQAFWGCLILIFFYILMIGAPVSGIRAAIMGILFLVAQHFGRISNGSRLMIFALSFMLVINPLLLKLDIGFQLSFLAVMGLLYLQPIFLEIFKKIPNFFQFRYNFSATLAAQFFTFPILVYNFGRVSAISFLPNILILPFLPLVTVLGFIFSFLGMIFYSLAQILSWPAWLLLTYFLKIVDFFSGFSFSSLNFTNVSYVWLLIFYSILGFIVWRLNERQRLNFLNY